VDTAEDTTVAPVAQATSSPDAPAKGGVFSEAAAEVSPKPKPQQGTDWIMVMYFALAFIAILIVIFLQVRN